MSTAPTGYQTPKTNWGSADVVLPADLNRQEGNIQAIEEGSRTIDPAQAPASNVGTLRQLLDWFANRLKAITGKTNWYDAPDITLATLAAHKSRHASGGADALSPSDIGAAAASHTHSPGQISPQGAGSGLDADLLDGKHLGQLALTLGFFGTGSDGDVTITADTTLSRSMFYNNLMINSGVTLCPNGFPIFVRNTLTVNGRIACNGGNANEASPGSGAPPTAGLIGFFAGGGQGGGGAKNANGNPGCVWGSATSVLSAGGWGGQGGAGGNAGSKTGGAPGTAKPLVVPFETMLTSISTPWATGVPSGQLILGGHAGTGGGGGGSSSPASFSGGGGGGGGIVCIFAYNVVIAASGSIEAKGGNGGVGTPYETYAIGGGGGGGGGAVIIIYKTIVNNGTISVAGGAGGAGINGGAAGSPGSSGRIALIQLEG